jgi:signal transduction histidine kinase
MWHVDGDVGGEADSWCGSPSWLSPSKGNQSPHGIFINRIALLVLVSSFAFFHENRRSLALRQIEETLRYTSPRLSLSLAKHCLTLVVDGTQGEGGGQRQPAASDRGQDQLSGQHESWFVCVCTCVAMQQRRRSQTDRLNRLLLGLGTELRTPMHGIIAMASDLKEMPLPSKAREAIGIISDCADHLLSLVNDVLDFARYQTRPTRAPCGRVVCRYVRRADSHDSGCVQN